MPDWGLRWNRMNGGDLDRGNRETDIVVTWMSECAPLRFLHIPPHAGLSGGGGVACVKCEHTDVEPTDTSRDVVCLWPLRRAWPQAADRLHFHEIFFKLHCVWRVGIDRGQHMLTYKWRAKVFRSGVDQLMDHPLIVLGIVSLTLLVHAVFHKTIKTP